jgi:hypothetical protein
MFIVKEGTTGGADTTPELRTEIIKWLGLEGMVVRTKDQDAQAIQTAIADATANRNIFAAIKEATGVDREANEEEGAYLKRATAKKLEEITTLKTKITEYENKARDGSTLATEYKAQLESLKASMAELQTKYNTDTANLNKLVFDTKVDNEIAMVVSDMPLRKMHDDERQNTELQKMLRESTIMKFKSEFTPAEQDGKIIFKDKGGHIVRKTEDGSPKGLNDVLTPYFEPLIDREHKATGAGSGKDNNNPPPPAGGAKDWSKVQLPPTVKSATQLAAWLNKEQKLAFNTKEFDEAYTHYNKDAEGKPLPTTPKAA